MPAPQYQSNPPARPSSPRLARLGVLHLALLTGIPSELQARDYFNPAFLQTGNPQQERIDLSAFEQGNAQAPGTYRVDIYLNNEIKDTREVTFTQVTAADGQTSLQPCFSVEELAAMGIRTGRYEAREDADRQCVALAVIPQARADFRFSQQQLFLTVPQSELVAVPRGYVPESLWDEGITAFLLNYSISGSRNYARDSDGTHSHDQYASLRPGLNLGAWRLRNYSSWSRSRGDSSGQWETLYTYAQRNIVSLKGQLTVGDSSSQADVFSSIPFRGIQLASDDEMLPDSLKGYAPVVRGIARSNAQVTVRQNGYVVYQSYVPPGPFELTDIVPAGGAGDLSVTIREADGSEQYQVVPFASLPVLQREGRLKYAATTGQYRTYDRRVEQTPFSQLTAVYGLPAGFTAYGGIQVAEQHQAAALGLGKNFGAWGALSGDVTRSRSTLKGHTPESGQSWRVRYSKTLPETGTTFTVAGYRYSSPVFYSLQDVLDTYRSGTGKALTDRRRQRSEVNLSQRLWQGAGSLSLSVVSEHYWHRSQRRESVSAGYNNSWKGVSFGVNYSYSRNARATGQAAGSGRDQQLSFSVSVPLKRWAGNTHATYNMNAGREGRVTHTAGLNGTALEDNNLSWSMQQGYDTRSHDSTGNLFAGFRGTYGDVNAGFARDSHNQRFTYGLSGGLVAHADGITLGQTLGETLVLVGAPGATGVSVENATGVKTDHHGWTLVPYASPYRKNAVTLSSDTYPQDVDIDLNSKTVIPTRGAVVKAGFSARVGQRVLMDLVRRDGSPVPFGATVTVPEQKDAQAYIVSDGGQVYLTGLADSGSLSVQWGPDSSKACRVNYKLSGQTDASGLQSLQAQCI
ncbi:fimbria/pilus outer membrane usher protein [Enterobacter bugandensis]|uniref:fimbria/pilus outer membrane usher protein n=1 Tax=Enterobacter bugandensis TaxID=881260 RepID=UPI0013D6FA6D|nr:fimbria/pilus outer membrane usher protein [Enterobacter bugandensis]